MKEPDKTAEALRESEGRLSRAQAMAHIGDWEWDVATNAVLWSDELYRIYGFEPREIAPDYTLILRQMHPDSKEEFLRAIDAALNGEKSFELDYTFFRKDGSEAILHTIGQVFRDLSGAPVRMAGTVQDITEQKRIELRLRNSEDKFRTIFDQANDGMLIIDISKQIFIETNRTFCRMLGYSRQEMLGLGIADIHPEKDLAAVQAVFEQQLQGQLSVAENVPVKRRDGTVFYTDISAARIDMGGNICMMGIFRDISERRQSEKLLRESEAFVRRILDCVDEGFIVVDQQFRILTANRVYCDHVGLPVEEVLGRHCYEISHNQSHPCHEEGEDCCVEKVFARGFPHTCYHRHEDAGGNITYVETKGFPLKDSSGVVIQAIETISDITEKRLLEDERLKVQKLEAIGTLAGGIAHDFNNLLQGVFGYLSIAKLLTDREKSIAALEEAERALQLSIKLTNQLLTFSKGGSPVKKPMDLQVVIDNAVRFSLSGSSATCQITSLEDINMVEADEGQITQVIQNIILNAIQAMPEGGRIEITARNISADDPDLPEGLYESAYVEIGISDQGSGIAEENLINIFDPYFTTKKKGSGLGLATSYSIIKNHAGKIRVISAPEQGSTFFIYLPASAGSSRQEQPQQRQVNTASRPGRILVMDDEPMIIEIAGSMIKFLGHEVSCALNGEEAVAQYQTARQSGKPFDIVILDLTIRGGAGGVETMRKLKELDPQVKSVVSSGYADNAVVANFREYGFLATLNKPYSVDELQTVINSILGAEISAEENRTVQ